MKKRIYIPQIDKIYDSVAAAAAELGVNASNLGKTLSGKRKSAGGYTAIDAASYNRGGKIVTPNRRSLRNKAVKSGLYSAGVDPLANKRRELQQLLIQSNAEAKKIRKAGIGFFAQYNNKAMDYVQDIGGRNGFYATDYKTLSKLSAAELDKFIAAIKNAQKYDTYTYAGAVRATNVRADNLGITFSQAQQYRDIMPIVFRTLDNILQKDWRYDEVVEKIVDAMDNQAAPEDILNILARVDGLTANIDFLLDYANNNYANMHHSTRKAIYDLIDAYNADPNNATMQQTVKVMAQLVGDPDAKEQVIKQFARYAKNNYTESNAQNNIDWLYQRTATGVNQTSAYFGSAIEAAMDYWEREGMM